MFRWKSESWRQDDNVVMLSSDTRSSVHHPSMIEERHGCDVLLRERFIRDGINQTEQVFYHSLRYTKMEEIQSASRQQFPCAISPSADDSTIRRRGEIDTVSYLPPRRMSIPAGHSLRMDPHVIREARSVRYKLQVLQAELSKGKQLVNHSTDNCGEATAWKKDF